MKAIILAGGRATRLYPLTTVTNKHLLPLYNKPIIYYAVEKLVAAGIGKIMIVTSPHHIEGFVNLLGSGQNFPSQDGKKQTQIVYGIQNKPTGIADGLWIAKDYVGDEDCVLYLGDNVFEDNISTHIKNFKSGATVFLKEVTDPERFGVAEIDKNGLILNITEKPKKPKSNLAVTGLYIYDNSVFKKFMGQKPSARGEYEITYINNKYIKEGKLKSILLRKPWFDLGTFDSLLRASIFMSKKKTDLMKKYKENYEHNS
jgi:glucose-1-phosphate thymidylyltransferase